MTMQNIKIDMDAYMCSDCIGFLPTLYEKVKEKIDTSKRYSLLDVELTEDSIHFSAEFENPIYFEVEDEYNFKGYGHYENVIDKRDFYYYFNKFLKEIDTNGYIDNIEDNSDFGDY